MPPPAVQLKRIALALGIPEQKSVQTSKQKPSLQSALSEAAAAGMPVFQGRPDDPMLDLIGL